MVWRNLYECIITLFISTNNNNSCLFLLNIILFFVLLYAEICISVLSHCLEAQTIKTHVCICLSLSFSRSISVLLQAEMIFLVIKWTLKNVLKHVKLAVITPPKNPRKFGHNQNLLQYKFILGLWIPYCKLILGMWIPYCKFIVGLRIP